MFYLHLLGSYATSPKSSASIPPILIGLLIIAAMMATKITLNIGPLKITLNKPQRRRKRTSRTRTRRSRR